MAVLFGGREAELILGGEKNVTNGASGDIQMATQLARAMVTEWGMSDKLGRVRYNGNEQEVFLGHSVTQTKNLSDQTAKLIDEAVRDLIQAGEATAKRILHQAPGRSPCGCQGAVGTGNAFRRGSEENSGWRHDQP